MKNLKQLIFVFTFLLLGMSSTFSQSPEGINYQATLRDASSNLMKNQSVTLEFIIREDSSNGNTAYHESHSLTTNNYGGVSTIIGKGSQISVSSLSSINWGLHSHFLQVKVNGTDLGTTQLMSVPYAMYAKTSGSSTPGPAGPQGLKGDTGVQGPVGPQGLTGAIGPVGPQGNAGVQGPIGPQGIAGPIGPQGPQGIIGPVGPQGIQGPIGLTGATGLQGPIGLTGATGPQGIQGPIGPKGDTGAIGPQGPMGLTGPQGPASSDNQNIDSITLNGNILTVYIENGNSASVVINQNSSIFEQVNDIVKTSYGYDSLNFVFGSTQIDKDLYTSHNKRMIYCKSKGAFRAGNVTNKQWDEDSLGLYSTATGYNTKATGYASFASGNTTTASGQSATATGSFSQASGNSAFASGSLSEATGIASTAMGTNSKASGNTATALGFRNTASGDYSLATGYFTTASSPGSVALGYQSIASNQYAIAGGYQSVAAGTYSISLGYKDSANSMFSVAIGSSAAARGDGSVAIGTNTKAIGGYSNATGIGTTASGYASTAQGAYNKSSGDFSVVSGHLNEANGDYSSASGKVSKANGEYSTAIGYNAVAEGQGSVAMGYGVKATGAGSASFGEYNEANGRQSTASGFYTIANGTFSFATGERTKANSYATTVVGMYNDTVTNIMTNSIGNHPLFIVGNGIGINNRSNALEVYKDGSVEINNAYSLPKQDGGSGNVMTTDGYGNLSWVNQQSLGVFQTSLNGIVPVGNQVAANFIVGSPDINQDNLSIHNSKMFFHKGKSAFRAGYVSNKNWDEDSLGIYSVATGNNCIAKGNYSVAMGELSRAQGDKSFAMGFGAEANGEESFAMGRGSRAEGWNSVAFGWQTTAIRNNSVAMGQWNVSHPDILFSFGDGSNGFNKNVIQLQKSSTSGNYHTFFRGGISPFLNGIDNLGGSSLRWNTVYTTNGVTQTSDTTQKTNILPLNYGLNELMQVKTISYNWKTEANGKRKIGFNAQNLLDIIPEVVTDSIVEKNQKTGELETKAVDVLGVNYSDMIPVLTKAIQEQQAMIEELKKKLEEIEKEKSENKENK